MRGQQLTTEAAKADGNRWTGKRNNLVYVHFRAEQKRKQFPLNHALFFKDVVFLVGKKAGLNRFFDDSKLSF